MVVSRLKSLSLVIAMVIPLLLTACGGGGGGGGGGNTSTTTNTPSGLKSFVQFSFTNPAANGVIDEQNKAIAITVPFGTNVTALASYFTMTGVSASVGGVTQVSGVTTNDFTSPVKYVVTAEDGTTATYTVTVTVAANSAKAITAFSFATPAATGVINESGKSIIVTVPSGTPLTALVASFTTTGQSVTVGGVAQSSGVTANNFSNALLYRVTAADGSYVDYTVTVMVAPSTAKAITAFSFPTLSATGVIDEVNKTIAVTVPFGTNTASLVASFSTSGVSVSVGGTLQTSGVTANSFAAPVSYVVTAADGTTASYTVTVTGAANSAKAITAFSFATPAATGVINESGKSIVVTVPSGTPLTALIASFTTTGQSVTVGGVAQSSGVTANNFSNALLYRVTAADGSYVDYTVTVMVAPSTAKAITAFSFPALNSTGVIDETNKTIAVTVPFGTSTASLVASFSTSGVSVSVGGTLQTSGATANNFGAPLGYVVTAADGTTTTYTVTVTVAANSAKAITAFSFAPIAGYVTINETAKTIDVTVPYGTAIDALAATFSTTGQSVTVGGVQQSSGVTVNNFLSPLTYTVTAADGSMASYVVTVTVSPSSAKQMTGFTGPSVNVTLYGGTSAYPVLGVIDEAAKTVKVPYAAGVNLTAVSPCFYTSGVTVLVGGVVQTSCASVQDFTNPVVYTIVAADGSTVNYTVTFVQTATSWSTQASGTTNALNGIATNPLVMPGSGSPAYVAVGATGTILTSPDMFAWTARTSGTANTLNSVSNVNTGAGSQFMALGAAGTVLTSPDGVTWTTQTSGTANALNSVTATPVWVYVMVPVPSSVPTVAAVGAAGTILTTTDGITWTPQVSGTTSNLNGVVTYMPAMSAPQFVTVGAGGIILTSSDGVTWTAQSSGTTNALNSITGMSTVVAGVATSQLVAVGAAGTILTSPDGITWTAQRSGTTSALTSVSWDGYQLVAVGAAGTILTSPDGITWTAQAVATTNALSAVLPSKTILSYIAVGAAGTIVTSP